MKNKLKYYIQSARLRTLPLSVAGIVTGIFLASTYHFVDVWVSIFALLTALSLQILSNYANEYGDMQKGTDNDLRVGPKRSIQSGHLSSKNIFNAIVIFIVLSLILGGLLVWFAFSTFTSVSALSLMLIGILAIIASIKYTVGKNAYGYAGLGDLFVFIFFGWVSVIGTFYLLTQQFSFYLLLPASTIGLLSVSMLNVNNMRDIENDKHFSKKTMAVRMGGKNAKIYHLLLILFAFLFSILYATIWKQSPFNFLFLITLPLFIYHLYRIFVDSGKELDNQMKLIALSTILFTILLGVGLLF